MSDHWRQLTEAQGFKFRGRLANGIELWRMAGRERQIFWRALYGRVVVADWHDAPGLGPLRFGGQIDGSFAAAEGLRFREWRTLVAEMNPAASRLLALRPPDQPWSDENDPEKK